MLTCVACQPSSLNLLTLSLPIPLRLYTLPYWSNPSFLIFDIQALSKIKNGGLDQYGAGPFEQQQFGGFGVKAIHDNNYTSSITCRHLSAFRPGINFYCSLTEDQWYEQSG